MENNAESSNEIDLFDIIRLVWSKIVWVLLAAVVCGIIGLLYSVLMVTPKYEASVNMIVNSREDLSGGITSDNITSAQKLAQTYTVIIKSNKVINEVIEALSLDTNYEELSKAISVSSLNSTPVMELKVTDTDAERASLIVSKLAEIVPPILSDAVGAGSCKIVSDVYSSGKPVSPSITKNVLIAAFLGAVLVILIIIVRDLLDNTFKSEIDIQNIVKLPVLGVLPSVESCSEAASVRKRRV